MKKIICSLLAAAMMLVPVFSMQGCRRNDEFTFYVDAIQFMLNAPVLAAYDRGYFADAGLNVNISLSANSEQSVGRLIGGDATNLVAANTETAMFAQAGHNVRIISTTVHRPTMFIIGRTPLA